MLSEIQSEASQEVISQLHFDNIKLIKTFLYPYGLREKKKVLYSMKTGTRNYYVIKTFLSLLFKTLLWHLLIDADVFYGRSVECFGSSQFSLKEE